jgi:hypothetical protein
MDRKDQVRYQVGRRTGLLRHLKDMDLPGRLFRIDQAIDELNITSENVDDILEGAMSRFL